MNSQLRSEIIRYGEFAQACYDSFDFDPRSKYCGTCKYQGTHFFEKLDMAKYGYRISRYLYATSNINLPNFFQRSKLSSVWSQHANWMGYVAVVTDDDEIEPNVELASNIVVNSSLGDRILNVDTADNSVDADPSISSKSSTRESGSTVRIRASWKPLVGMLARGGLEFESHPGLLPLQAE
ncbi:hypothetical protein Tco_0904303 [Tanacetum coccineum]